MILGQEFWLQDSRACDARSMKSYRRDSCSTVSFISVLGTSLNDMFDGDDGVACSAQMAQPFMPIPNMFNEGREENSCD